MPPPYALDDTFSLHSFPGGTKRVYLDFDGHYSSVFESSYGAYDFEGNTAVFDEAERVEIRLIWQAAAEGYLPIVGARENKSVLHEYPHGDERFIFVENYIGPAGLMMAIRAGIHRWSVRRPLGPTTVLSGRD